MPFTLPKYTWNEDRELCKRCKHYRESKDTASRDTGAVVMLCTVNPQKGSRGMGTCIDNRTRGPCKAEGWLFQPKESEWMIK